MLDPKKLVHLPGRMGEEKYFGQSDETWTEDDYAAREYMHDAVDEVTQSMREKGWDQDNPSGPVFIIVEADGHAYIFEGNKRVRAAAATGIDKIPVEVRYCGGSEIFSNSWHPTEAL